MISNKSYAQTLNPTINGVWMGTYICAQGETGVRLTLNSINGSSFDGIFDFFPICSNYDKNVEVGKYYVIGSIDDNGNVTITALTGTGKVILCVNATGVLYRGNTTGCP